jgi:ABC-type amino acid transport substrate-binding protein
LVQHGVLRVGFDPQQFPFSFFNRKGDLVGFDVEMAYEFAREADARIEFVPMNVNQTKERLEADHVDIVMSGLPATLGRAAETEISVPYMDVHAAFLVLDKDKSNFESLERVRGLEKTVLAVADETIAFAAQRYLPEASFRNLTSISEFFESPEPVADALVISAEAGTAWTLIYPNYNVVIPRDLRGGVPLVSAAFGLRRSDVSRRRPRRHS